MGVTSIYLVVFLNSLVKELREVYKRVAIKLKG